MGARPDRRNVKRRAQTIQRAIAEVMHAPRATITLDALEHQLGVGREVAQRILRRLVSSGVLQEVREGLWARRGWAAAHDGSAADGFPPRPARS